MCLNGFQVQTGSLGEGVGGTCMDLSGCIHVDTSAAFAPAAGAQHEEQTVGFLLTISESGCAGSQKILPFTRLKAELRNQNSEKNCRSSKFMSLFWPASVDVKYALLA